jgi:hypothetical protein
VRSSRFQSFENSTWGLLGTVCSTRETRGSQAELASEGEPSAVNGHQRHTERESRHSGRSGPFASVACCSPIAAGARAVRSPRLRVAVACCSPIAAGARTSRKDVWQNEPRGSDERRQEEAGCFLSPREADLPWCAAICHDGRSTVDSVRRACITKSHSSSNRPSRVGEELELAPREGGSLPRGLAMVEAALRNRPVAGM